MADSRISYQVKALREAGADACGLSSLHFFDPSTRQAWCYEYPAGGVPWLAGGTLCYTARHWRANPFPPVQRGEDSLFVAGSRSARLLSLTDSSFYLALVHRGNTSGRHTSSSRYHPVPFERVAEWLGPDLQTYLGTAASLAPTRITGTPHTERPLVSCIMPTCDRRFFVPQALRYFLRQDYPRKELVVVDDGGDCIRDLIPGDPRVRYVRVEGRLSLGEKRNLAVRHSLGTIIAHWDDDDWYHPSYLSSTAASLIQAAGMRTICGAGTYLVWIAGEPSLRVCRSPGIAGATFMYFKRFW